MKLLPVFSALALAFSFSACLVFDAIRPFSGTALEEENPDGSETMTGATGPTDSPTGPTGATGGPVTLVTLAPTSATVGFAKTLAIVATVTGGTTQALTWSFAGDGTGATIAQDGTFAAPMYKKSYTVKAESVETPGISATMTIDVALTQLVHIAGALGGEGYADDVGVDARMSGPDGVALGPGGAFYFTSAAPAIRRVALDGTVTTIAGHSYDSDSTDGPGASARFGWAPRGIVGDATDTLFVADTGNHTIRKLQLSGGTWTVSTFAGAAGMIGTGDHATDPKQARFHGPEELVIDQPHRLLIVYMYQTRAIRTIDVSTPSGGAVKTVCNAAQLAAGGMDGLAIDPISVPAVREPRLVATRTTGAVHVIASWNGTDWVCSAPPVTYVSPDLSAGVGIAWSQTRSRIFMADYAGCQLFQADAIMNTLPYSRVDLGGLEPYGNQSYDTGDTPEPGGSGTQPPSARYVGGIALTADESLLAFAESENHKMRFLRFSDMFIGSLAGRAENKHADVFFRDGVGDVVRMAGPRALTVDAAGNVYVLTSSFSARYVRKFPADGSASTTITLPSLWSPTGIAFEPATGGLIVTSGCAGGLCDHHRVYFISAATGGNATITAQLGSTTNGVVDDAAGTNNAAVQFSGPTGIAVVPSDVPGATAGTIFVTDTRAHVIRRIVRQGGAFVVDTFQGASGVTGTTNDTDGSASTLGARFHYPTGLAVSGSALFVADSGNTRIRRIDLSTRNSVTIAGSSFGRLDGPGNVARFGYPEWLAVDGAGTLYVSNRDPDPDPPFFDTGYVRVIENALTATVASGTTVSTLAGDMPGMMRGVKTGPLPARLHDVYGLGFTPRGDLALVSENSLLFLR